MKKILITGANSYIGMSVEKYLINWNNSYSVDTLDMLDADWRRKDFGKYDIVYHVAGIAHADVGAVTEEQKQLYYDVNTNLAIDVAEKAKKDGVGQFIFMSSMIVYSGCKEKIISRNTMPIPQNFYGDSKLQAEIGINKLASEKFHVVILRPPMIYGKDSKGNYQRLAKLAVKTPIFPMVNNKRSMLYIENLCEFVRLMIENDESGVFFPQNAEYTNTTEMVRMIAKKHNHGVLVVHGVSWIIWMLQKIPGKIGTLVSKAFGDSAYEMDMSIYKERYCIYSLQQSIEITEKA